MTKSNQSRKYGSGDVIDATLAHPELVGAILGSPDACICQCGRLTESPLHLGLPETELLVSISTKFTTPRKYARIAAFDAIG